MLRIPFPEVHPRFPWRPLWSFSGRDNVSIELASPVGDASSLVVGLRAGHVDLRSSDRIVDGTTSDAYSKVGILVLITLTVVETRRTGEYVAPAWLNIKAGKRLDGSFTGIGLLLDTDGRVRGRAFLGQTPRTSAEGGNVPLAEMYLAVER